MKTRSLILVFFVLLKFIIQYFSIDPVYELHRDEYLHLDLGNHLAWGYASVPPVTGWLSYLIISLGKSVFWVKFFPALFGALTTVVVWKIITELKGNLFALVLGATCITFSVLLRINTLYQPNSLEFLLWTVVFYTVIKYVNSEQIKWLWLSALTFVIGFLNKYNISFLILGLLPSLLLSEHRKIFTNKHLYFALAAAIVLIIPNLIWQYQNDFPVITHLSTLAKTHLVNVNRFNFLKEQLMFFTGSLAVILAAFYSFFWYAPFKKYKFIFWTYLFVILIYTYLKAKSYYAIGLYPVLIAFGATYLEKALHDGWKRVLKPVLILFPIALMLLIYPIILPVLTPQQIVEKPELFKKFGLLRWEDGKDYNLPQDFADMLGWSELGSLVDQAFDSVTDKNNTLIHCDDYGQAGAINYYAGQKFTEALTMDADYLNWYPVEDMEINNVILVKGSWDDDPQRKKEAPLFESILYIGEIKNEFAREKGARVYLLKGAKRSINDIIKAEIANKKNSFHD
jgi:hypothetical protein